MNSYNVLGHALAFFMIVGCGVYFELKRKYIADRIGRSNLRYFLIFVIGCGVALSNALMITKGLEDSLKSIAVFIPLIWIFSRSPSVMNRRQHLSKEDVIIPIIWPAFTFTIVKVLRIENTLDTPMVLQITMIALSYLIGLIAVWYGGIPRYICYWCVAALFLIASYHIILRF